MEEKDLQQNEAPLATRPMAWARTGIVLAWIVIVGMIGLIVLGGAVASPSDERPAIGSQQELVGRVVLGIAPIAPEYAFENANVLESGPPIDRIAYAILVAAIEGPEAGDLELVSPSLDPDDPLNRLTSVVRASFERAMSTAEERSPMSEEDAAMLRSELGWFGDLAIALADPSSFERIQGSAVVTFIRLIVLMCLMGVLGLGGFVGLVVLLAVRSSRASPSREGAGSQTSPGVYVETFALWLAGFSLAQATIVEAAPDSARFIVGFLSFMGSLVVLGWPVVRGVPWAQVRRDIGLTRFSPIDIPCGVAVYAMSLPCLLAGVLVALGLQVLIDLFGGEVGTPSHPVQEVISGAGGGLLLQLFLIAVVAAPIVEEIMFRGVLYAHLRGGSRRWLRWLSIGFAALVSSAIFAIIHPQGLVFAPILAGLAVGFCIGREWRGSIYASIVAHGVNNAIVLSLNLFIIG